MRTGAVFIFLLLLCACGEENDFNKNNEQKIEPDLRLFVKNASDYSDDFIAGFKRKHSRYKIAWLKSDTILLYAEKERMARFPSGIELHKTYHYATIAEKGYYTLALHRINYSSIDCECTRNKEVIIRGIVHIDPLFYEPDEKSGRKKDPVIYTGKNENGERLDILVGIDGKTASLVLEHDTISDSYFMVGFTRIHD